MSATIINLQQYRNKKHWRDLESEIDRLITRADKLLAEKRRDGEDQNHHTTLEANDSHWHQSF